MEDGRPPEQPSGAPQTGVRPLRGRRPVKVDLHMLQAMFDRPQPEAAQSTPDRVAQTLSRAASETFNLGFLKDMLKCGAPRSRRAVSTVPGQQSGVSA